MVATRKQIDDEPEPVVCPFSVLIDTREQTPYHFLGLECPATRRPYLVRTITDQYLETGDYSIAGLSDRITIERKSLSDWHGSIGGDREREERKASRMAEFEFAAYVIESDWQGMKDNWPKSAQISPLVSSGTIISWSMRYGIHFFLMPSRRDAEKITFRLLLKFWGMKQEEKRIEQEILDKALPT